MNKLGESIKQARENIGMSQKTLASLLGVQINTVWRWEKGEREPSWEMMQKIAELLKTPELVDPLSKLSDSTVNQTLGLSYWGSVVDNARSVAMSGDRDKINEVLQLLELAISPLLKIIQPEASMLSNGSVRDTAETGGLSVYGGHHNNFLDNNLSIS